MWPLWLFLILFVAIFLAIAGLAGYADHMGRPGTTNYPLVIAVAALFSGTVTLIAMGIGSLF